MEASQLPHEDIERYLLDEMSTEEKSLFESEIKANASLLAEVNLQQQIIGGIGLARKQALKARLSAIPVSVAPLGGFMSTAWMKVISGTLIVCSLSVLTYWQLNQPEPDLSFSLVESEIVAPLDTEIPTINIPVKEIVVTAHTNPLVDDGISAKKEKIAVLTEDRKPVVVIPEVEIPENESQLIEETEMVSSDEIIDNEAVSVRLLFETSKEERSYRYFNSELTLRGDFDGVTYDLIELNNSNGKSYFIQIGTNYYALPPSEDFQPFVKISDPDKIKELELLKNY